MRGTQRLKRSLGLLAQWVFGPARLLDSMTTRNIRLWPNQIFRTKNVNTILHRLFFICFALLLFFQSCYSQILWANNENLCDYTNDWVLVFEDDFRGNSLNTDKWTTWQPFSSDGSDACEACRAAHGVIYRDEQIFVNDGVATIRATKEFNTWYGQPSLWKSGILFSKQPFTFNQGKFEIRCKLNLPQGAIPSFWLFGDGGNEIDVFEFCGGEYTVMKCSIHRNEDNPTQHDTYDASVPDISGSFHTYGVEWSENFVIWFFDGVEIHRRCRWDEITDNDDCILNGPYTRGCFPADDSELNVLASLGMSDGGFCGPENSYPTGFSFDMDIDYIRVFQNMNQIEPELTNVCGLANTLAIAASSDAFCSIGQQVTYNLTGVHGDPIQWSVSGPGYSFVATDNSSARIQFDAYYEASTVVLTVVDNENPCGSTQKGIPLYGGLPTISLSDYHLDMDCDDDGSGYWCIEPEIWNAEPIQPSTISSYTSFYPPIAYYNEYVVGSNNPPVYSVLNSVPRPYRVFIYDEEQTRVFLPMRPEVVPGGEIYGYSWTLPPLTCQEHWHSWPWSGESRFCLKDHGDYCYEVVVQAQNPCGVSEARYTIRDNCQVGACDESTPYIPDELEVELTPVPATTGFTISAVADIDVVARISGVLIQDALGTIKWSHVGDLSSSPEVNCSNWGPGIYAVHVFVDGVERITKIQIK
ncbi:MAG: glycoside hydrolase family 16 protein [Flavobacteriales bacterium]|nr:glycoside hydrolase family 16 protein [Flavobacteriales bacterium]